MSLTLECNSAATIYWGIGLYPTLLGITSEQIEVKLIDQLNGLQQRSQDIYSWSQELYGLEYTRDANALIHVNIEGLQGGLHYIYKYFCVDQTGTASGGKIVDLHTPSSNYSLVKISIAYASPLTYDQTN